MNEILNINIKDNPPTQEALDQLRIQALNNLNVIKKLDKRLYYAFIILVSLGITSLMVIMFGMDNIVEAKFSSLDWITIVSGIGFGSWFCPVRYILKWNY